jgi:hypothetical protein
MPLSKFRAAAEKGNAYMEITDRAGRVWQITNYDSPSGPAFSITVPDEPSKASGWASGFTAHFDGSIIHEPRRDGDKP